MINTKEMRAKYVAKNGRAPAGAVDVRELCDALDKIKRIVGCKTCMHREVEPSNSPCNLCYDYSSWEPTYYHRLEAKAKP